jgi:peptidoglycan LD-endopeptidase LytH
MIGRLVVLSLTILAGCNGIKSLKNNLNGLTPYEEYVKSLERANLHDRPMAKKWRSAGEKVFKDSVWINLPFTETGHFISHRPEARSYRFTAKDGQVLTINGALQVTQDAKIFTDLFIWQDNEWKSVASSDSSLTLSHEFTRDSKCLLRIQPELLVNAYYSVSIGLTPILINPVSGAGNRSIQSFYGASRDGGKRSHEGVDIFAKKGTPIIAPTEGTISRVGYSRLGGKVVWMYDQKRGHSYYFAHLDSQYVKAGMMVKQGDVLGTVGNTGNARFTPAHLHFGIYQAKSKDPLHYIKTLDALTSFSPIDTSFKFASFKIAVKNSALRTGPALSCAEIGLLQKDTYVNVIARSNDWVRVSLPDNTQGFVLKKEVVAADKGIKLVPSARKELLSDVYTGRTVVDYIEPNTTVEQLAKFKTYTRIRTAEGIEGWIQ